MDRAPPVETLHAGHILPPLAPARELPLRLPVIA